MSGHDQTSEQSTGAYLLLVPAGLCLGLGLVLLYYSYGWDVAHLNQDIGGAGFSGLDNLAPQWGLDFSIGFIVLGNVGYFAGRRRGGK